MSEHKRYVVMLNNNRYFKDDCILSSYYKWWDGDEYENLEKMLLKNSTMDVNEARVFNNVQSITSALGVGGLARSRAEFTIIEVSIVPGSPVL